MKTKFFLIFILLASKLFAQYGDIDLTFNPGTSTTEGFKINDVDYNSTSKKIIVGGNFDTFAGIANKGVALLNEDGSLDTGFTSPFNSNPLTVTITKAKWLPDGKIIVVTADHIIKKLNLDGSIDASFTLTTNGGISAIYPEDNGKIVIAGGFTIVSGVPRNGLAKITNTGSVDATFYPGSGIPAGQYVYGIDKQSNGKYIIGGYFWQYDIYNVNYIARLNSDGTFDGTFNPGTAANNTIAKVSTLKNDKIVVSGMFTDFNGFASTNKVAQLNSDGSVDNNAFLGNFSLTGPITSKVSHVLLPDGQFILYSDENFTFPGGTRNKIAKIDAKGFLNHDFNPGTSLSHPTSLEVNKTIVLPTGKLLVAGRFNNYNGTSILNIARILNKLDNPSTSYCHQVLGRISALSGTTNGRIYTNGDTSVCGIAKPFPGITDVGNLYYYNTHTFTNNSSVSQCVTFNLKTLANNNDLDLAIYNGSFNNTNLSQNYLADIAQIITLGYSKSCSVTVAPYQTIVCVVTENTSNYNSANGNYVLSIDGLCNSPTVTVKAMPGFDYSTRKPVVYYSAKFNMPIAGLTASDIVIDTDTGSTTKAFIKETGLASNNKDFIIGVTGMQNEGYVDIKIPANSVFSLDEGTGNLTSINLSFWSNHSNSQTTFLNSGFSCSKPSSDGVIQNIHQVNVYNTPDSNCGFTKNYFIDNGIFNSKVHTYQNTSGFDKCIGVKVKKNGLSSYFFNAYKSNSFMSGGSQIDWIGGSDGATYSYNGDTYDCSYIDVPNGGNFYIQVFTENDDYEIVLTDIFCWDVLANENFAMETNFTIYPNPSPSIFNISSSEKIENIKIFNMIGQIILETHSNVVDLSTEDAGVYLAEITIDGKKATKRIIKN